MQAPVDAPAGPPRQPGEQDLTEDELVALMLATMDPRDEPIPFARAHGPTACALREANVVTVDDLAGGVRSFAVISGDVHKVNTGDCANRSHMPSSPIFSRYAPADLAQGSITPPYLVVTYMIKLSIDPGTPQRQCADLASIKGEMAPCPGWTISLEHRQAVEQLVAHMMDKQRRIVARTNVQSLHAKQPSRIQAYGDNYHLYQVCVTDTYPFTEPSVNVASLRLLAQQRESMALTATQHAKQTRKAVAALQENLQNQAAVGIATAGEAEEVARQCKESAKHFALAARVEWLDNTYQWIEASPAKASEAAAAQVERLFVDLSLAQDDLNDIKRGPAGEPPSE